MYPCVPCLCRAHFQTNWAPSLISSASISAATSSRAACLHLSGSCKLSRACGWSTTGSLGAFLGPGAMHQSPLHCMWTTTQGCSGSCPPALRAGWGRAGAFRAQGWPYPAATQKSSRPSFLSQAPAAAAATMMECSATAPPVGQSASCPSHASLDTAACSAAHYTVAVCTLFTSAMYLVACSASLCCQQGSFQFTATLCPQPVAYLCAKIFLRDNAESACCSGTDNAMQHALLLIFCCSNV